MNTPDFTPEEQMMVGFYKSHKGVSYFDVLSTEATYLAAAIVMIVAGAFFESYALAASALFVSGLLKLRETMQQPPTMRTMASIIAKYEAKIAELSTIKPAMNITG